MNINLTLLGQTISFALFVWFCMKFVWPPIIGALNERKQKIVDGLAAAERGAHEQELAQKKAAMVIKESHDKASEIIAHAKTRDNEMVEEAKAKAQIEAVKITEKAQADISKEIYSAREKLRTEVSVLALQGAKQIVGREINADDHGEILNKLSAQL